MDEKTDAREAQPKPLYEAPTVVKLGELRSGEGQQQLCTVGTSALGDCTTGNAAGLLCDIGNAGGGAV